MLTFEMTIERSVTMDVTKLNSRNMQLSDVALQALIAEDISVVLRHGEELSFDPGYRKFEDHYVVTAKITSPISINYNDASRIDRVKHLNDLNQRLAVVENAITNEEKRRLGHDRWRNIGHAVVKGVVSLPERIAGFKIIRDTLKPTYFRAPMVAAISEVDFGDIKTSAIDLQQAAETARKQAGENLKNLTQSEILVMLDTRIGDIAILQTGHFGYWEDELHQDPRVTEQYGSDCDHDRIQAFAVGRIESNGAFSPIKCHIPFSEAKEIAQEYSHTYGAS